MNKGRFGAIPLCKTLLLAAGLWLAGPANLQAETVPETADPKASEATSTQDAQALQQLLGKLQSLTGRFTQTLSDPAGEVLQESHGEFAIERPGKFYWHTFEPFEQLLVSNQETLWLYDPDLEQVTVRPFDERLQQTPALILSGDLQTLSDSFDIHRKAEAEQDFVLTPRGEQSLFASLSLTFTAGELTDMRLLDSLGQETHFALLGVQQNPALADGKFQFEAPPGTDVLIDE